MRVQSIFLLAIAALLFIAFANVEAKPTEKARLSDIVSKLTADFMANKKKAEDRLFNLYKKATIAKIESLSAIADAEYAEVLVSTSERLLKSLDLYSKLEKRKLGLNFLLGRIPSHPGEECGSIKKSNKAATSGVYFIKDTSAGNETNAIYKTICEMSNVGGGWTLVGTKSSGFDLKSINDAKNYLNEDMERELLVEGGLNHGAFPTLSMERFDKPFGVRFQLLVEIRENASDKEAEYIQIISSTKSVALPSSVSEGLLTSWRVAAGTHCNVIEGVGRACRVNSDGSPAHHAKQDIVPFAKGNLVNIYIRS